MATRECRTGYFEIVRDAIRDAGKQADGIWLDEHGFRTDEYQVISASLQAMAEALADDGFAKARRSKREVDLRHAIENSIREHERRSRENGWSYTAHLTRDLGPWPPVRVKAAVAPTRKATVPRKRKLPED